MIKRIAAFVLGMIEFRLSITAHFYDDRMMSSYDSGREWAHRLTFRRFDT